MKDKKKNDQILQEDQATDDLEIIELTDSADADDAEFIELTDSADKSFSEQEKITEPDSDDDAEIAVIPEDSDDPVLLDDIAGEILAGDEELIEFDEMISLDDIAEEDVMEDEEVIDLDAADVTDHQNVTDSLPDDVSPGDEGEFAESEIEKSAAMNDMDENIADSADIGTDEDEDDEDVIELDMKNIRASSDSDEPVLLRESAGSTDENENADDFDDAETIFAPTDLDDKAGKDDDIVALEDEAAIIAPPDLDETILLHDTAEDKRFAKSFYGAGTAEKEDDIVALEDEATIIAPPDLDETIFLRDDDERQATHVPKQGLGNENEPPVRDPDPYSDDEATIIAPPDLDETIFLGDDSEESDQHDDDDIIDLNDEAAIIEQSDFDETIFLRDDDEKHVPKQGLGNEKKQGLGNEKRTPERGNRNEPPVRYSDSYSGDEATIIAPPDLDGGDFFGAELKKQDQQDDDDIIDLSDEESIKPDSDETIFIQDVARKAVRQKEDDSNGLSDPDGTILFQDEAKKATEAYDIIELSPENIVAPPPLEDPTLSGEVISKRNKKVADHGILHSDRDEGTGERPEDTGTPITDIDDVIRLADKASTDFKPAAAGKNLSAESDDILFGSEAEALLSESPYLSEDIPEIRDDKSESQRRDKGLSDLIADDLKQQSGSPESASDDREGNQYIPAEIPARVLQKEDDTAAEAQPSDSKDIKEEIHQKKPSDSAPRVRHLPDSVSLPPPEQLEAILEQVIKKVFSEKMFSEKIENKLVEVIEKAVANEMDRLKDVLFEDLADED